jgi:hypothetical protein
MLLLLFSKGQKVFALIFFILFAIMLIWAYASDAKSHKINYKNVWSVLLGVIIILVVLTYLIKATH